MPSSSISNRNLTTCFWTFCLIRQHLNWELISQIECLTGLSKQSWSKSTRNFTKNYCAPNYLKDMHSAHTLLYLIRLEISFLKTKSIRNSWEWSKNQPRNSSLSLIETWKSFKRLTMSSKNRLKFISCLSKDRNKEIGTDPLKSVQRKLIIVWKNT